MPSKPSTFLLTITFSHPFFHSLIAACSQAFNMFNDVIISEDGPLDGYVVVFDMEGVCLRHLTRVQISPLRNFMAYIQVCVLASSCDFSLTYILLYAKVSSYIRPLPLNLSFSLSLLLLL